MRPNRTGALTRRAATQMQPAAPPDEDPERELRHRHVIDMFAGGDADVKRVVRSLIREFKVLPDQARADVQDVQEKVRAHLDSEANIDVVMVGAVARLNMLEQHFIEMAMQPVPDRVLDVPDANPDGPPDGPGAIYRPLTAGEHASAVGARARAGDTALKYIQTRIALLGKRSKRWADKPANVVLVSSGAATPEDVELLKKLGMNVEGA